MAAFTINFSAKYNSTSGSGIKDSIDPGTKTYSQTGTGYHAKTQSVTTSATSLEVIEDAALAGRLYMQNLDSDNSILWGSSLQEFVLPASDFAWVQISSSTAILQVEASTGTINLFAKLYEF